MPPRRDPATQIDQVHDVTAQDISESICIIWQRNLRVFRKRLADWTTLLCCNRCTHRNTPFVKTSNPSVQSEAWCWPPTPLRKIESDGGVDHQVAALRSVVHAAPKVAMDVGHLVSILDPAKLAAIKLVPIARGH